MLDRLTCGERMRRRFQSSGQWWYPGRDLYVDGDSEQRGFESQCDVENDGELRIVPNGTVSVGVDTSRPAPRRRTPL